MLTRFRAACATIVLLLLVAALGSPSARAQQNDHLACYKIRDPHNFTADVALVGSLLGTADCNVKIKAKQYCVPVTKTVASTDAPQLLFASPPQQRDLLCYKIKCVGDIAVDPLAVSDQFGTRTIERGRVVTLCTPAVVGPPPMFCGDGLVNQPSEQCDGQPNSCPSENCLDDCTCGPMMCCDIGCTYIPAVGPGHGYDCPSSQIECQSCVRSGQCCDSAAFGCMQATPEQDWCDVFSLAPGLCTECSNCCDMGGYCLTSPSAECASLGGTVTDCAVCWGP